MNCLNGPGRGGGQGTSGGWGQWQKIPWTQCCRRKCQLGVAALSCITVHPAYDMHREGELSEGEDQGNEVDLPVCKPHPKARVSSLLGTPFCFYKGEDPFLVQRNIFVHLPPERHNRSLRGEDP